MNKKAFRKVLAAGVLAALLLTASACSELDVVGNGSVSSFEAVLNTIPDQIAKDEANGGWSLTAPDGTARFFWSADWSKSPVYDAMLIVDAGPFLNAGLKPEMLPQEYIYADGMLMVGRDLGDTAPATGSETPLSAYAFIVANGRSAISYHMAMDHFGIALGSGMFECAKDMHEIDKDIVFVLNPEPLIAAGVNPEAVEGWAYGEVEVHQNGKTVKVFKFLKPFNLI